MKISLKQLEIFSAVAKQLSFTRAAKQLSLSQPAISRQMKNLEDACGTPLFEYLGKRLYLTDSGQRLLSHVHTVERQVEQLKADMHHEEASLQGTLTISVANALSKVVFQLLGQFYQKYPKVRFDVLVTNRRAQLRQLDENRVDMCLMSNLQKKPGLQSRLLFTSPLILVALPSHPLANKSMVTLAALEHEAFILGEEDTDNYICTQRLIKMLDLKHDNTIRIQNHDAVIDAVKAGLGLALLPRFLVDEEVQSGQLAHIDVQECAEFRAGIYLVHHKDKVLTPIAESFKSFMLQAIEPRSDVVEYA